MSEDNKKKLLPCCYCAPCEVLHSIALEEAALSHILNAEGEKIQKAVATEGVTIEELLCVNRSVATTLREVSSLEMILLAKLEAACNCNCCPVPPHPPIPCEKGWICVCVTDCCTKEGLSDAKICIWKHGKLVAEGCTDCSGRFTSQKLDFCEYCVKIEYDNLPIKAIEVRVEKCCCHDIECCFAIRKPCPPSCKLKSIKIVGRVTDECGMPRCASVLAEGVNRLEVQTDKCGNFNICGLIVREDFSITPFCGCKRGITSIIHVTENICYHVNLILCD